MFENLNALSEMNQMGLIRCLHNFGADDDFIESLKNVRYSKNKNICFTTPYGNEFSLSSQNYRVNGNNSGRLERDIAKGNSKGPLKGNMLPTDKKDILKQFQDVLTKHGFSEEEINLCMSNVPNNDSLGFNIYGINIKAKETKRIALGNVADIVKLRGIFSSGQAILTAFENIKASGEAASDIPYVHSLNPVRARIEANVFVWEVQCEWGYAKREHFQGMFELKVECSDTESVKKDLIEKKIIETLPPEAKWEPVFSAFEKYQKANQKYAEKFTPEMQEVCSESDKETLHFLKMKPGSQNKKLIENKRRGKRGLVFTGSWYAIPFTYDYAEKKAEISTTAFRKERYAFLKKAASAMQKVQKCMAWADGLTKYSVKAHLKKKKVTPYIEAALEMPLDGMVTYPLEINDDFASSLKEFKAKINRRNFLEQRKRLLTQAEADPLYGNIIAVAIFSFLEENPRSSLSCIAGSLRQVQYSTDYHAVKECKYTDSFSIVSKNAIEECLHKCLRANYVTEGTAHGDYGYFSVYSLNKNALLKSLLNPHPTHYPKKQYDLFTDEDWICFVNEADPEEIKDFAKLLPIIYHPAVFDLESENVKRIFSQMPEKDRYFLKAYKVTLSDLTEKKCLELVRKAGEDG